MQIEGTDWAKTAHDAIMRFCYIYIFFYNDSRRIRACFVAMDAAKNISALAPSAASSAGTVGASKDQNEGLVVMSSPSS